MAKPKPMQTETGIGPTSPLPGLRTDAEETARNYHRALTRFLVWMMDVTDTIIDAPKTTMTLIDDVYISHGKAMALAEIAAHDRAIRETLAQLDALRFTFQADGPVYDGMVDDLHGLMDRASAALHAELQRLDAIGAEIDKT